MYKFGLIRSRITGVLLPGLVIVAAMAVTMQAAQAVPITGLFNTGVDASGNPITPFSAGADTHYTLEGPDFPLGPANVINPHIAWTVPVPTDARWIGRADGAGGNTPSAFYTFTTLFDLTGLNQATAQISGSGAVDDALRILLNGVDVGGFSGFTTSLKPFSVTTGFVAGVNTLQFVVQNSTFTGVNPMGLLISGLSGTADIASVNTVPIPAALPLLASGLAGLGLLSWRRKRRPAA